MSPSYPSVLHGPHSVLATFLAKISLYDALSHMHRHTHTFGFPESSQSPKPGASSRGRAGTEELRVSNLHVPHTKGAQTPHEGRKHLGEEEFPDQRAPKRGLLMLDWGGRTQKYQEH